MRYIIMEEVRLAVLLHYEPLGIEPVEEVRAMPLVYPQSVPITMLFSGDILDFLRAYIADTNGHVV